MSSGAMDSVFGEVLDKGSSKQQVKTPSKQPIEDLSSQEVKAPSPVETKLEVVDDVDTSNAQIAQIAQIELELREARDAQAQYTEADARYWQVGNKVSNLQSQLNDARYKEQQSGMNAVQNKSGVDEALSSFSGHERYGELSGLIKAQLNTPQGKTLLAQSPQKFQQAVGMMYKALAFDTPQGGSTGGVKSMGNGGGSAAMDGVLKMISDEQREEFRKWNLPSDDKAMEKFAPYIKQQGDVLSHTMPLKGIRPKGAPRGMWNEAQ